MKLGEALTLRSDIQNRIQRVRGRLLASALVQEGENPPEDPDALLSELDGLVVDLEGIVARINRTNLATTLPDGRTLTDALARRDAMTLRQAALRETADKGSEKSPRYLKSEMRVLSTVDVRALRAEADRLAKELRELDTAIQETNWQTDLVD